MHAKYLHMARFELYFDNDSGLEVALEAYYENRSARVQTSNLRHIFVQSLIHSNNSRKMDKTPRLGSLKYITATI